MASILRSAGKLAAPFAAAGGLALSAAPAIAYSRAPVPANDKSALMTPLGFDRKGHEWQGGIDSARAALVKNGLIVEIRNADGTLAQITNPKAFGKLSPPQKIKLVQELAKESFAPTAIPKSLEGAFAAHIVNGIVNPVVAISYLSEEKTLHKEKLTAPDVMMVQIALNILGYDAGKVTGQIDAGTAFALEGYLKENPLDVPRIKPALIAAMARHVETDRMNILFERNRHYTPVASDEAARLPKTTPDGKVLLDPELIDAMHRRPEIKRIVQAAMGAAVDPSYKYMPISPYAHANQLWRELLFLYDSNPKKWPLDFFNNVTIGKKGEKLCCWGVGQFHIQTATPYLDDPEDIKDPIKNAVASARYMRFLTDSFEGRQRLAEGKYNGPGSLPWIEKLTGRKIDGTGKDRLTDEVYSNRLLEENARCRKAGKTAFRLYCIQTAEYVGHIASTLGFWPASKIARAHRYPENTLPTTVSPTGEIVFDKPKIEAKRQGQGICRMKDREEYLKAAMQAEIDAEKIMANGDGVFSQADIGKIFRIKMRFDKEAAKLSFCADIPYANSARFSENNAGIEGQGRFSNPPSSPATLVGQVLNAL